MLRRANDGSVPMQWFAAVGLGVALVMALITISVGLVLNEEFENAAFTRVEYEAEIRSKCEPLVQNCTAVDVDACIKSRLPKLQDPPDPSALNEEQLRECEKAFDRWMKEQPNYSTVRDDCYKAKNEEEFCHAALRQREAWCVGASMYLVGSDSAHAWDQIALRQPLLALLRPFIENPMCLLIWSLTLLASMYCVVRAIHASCCDMIYKKKKA